MIGVRSGIDEYGQPAKEVISGYIGEFKYFGFSEVPPHCLACDGSEISRETYNELFAVFGETFGAGDGTTTFNLPDLRGAFLRCIGGNAAELGTGQGDAIRNITGERPAVLDAGGTPTGAFGGKDGVQRVWATGSSGYYVTLTFDASLVVPTADDNRPVNYSVNVCVVYE